MDAVKAHEIVTGQPLNFTVRAVTKDNEYSHSVVVIGLDGSLNKARAAELAEALTKVVDELKEPTPALATLSKLADMATNLRVVQKRYFENRQSMDLSTSKKLERELDAFLKDYEKGIATASQANLF